MTIFLNIFFLILGMILLIKGADFFVRGASEVAKKFKIPVIFIGLTIVAIGTSLPELSISIASAISGSTDLSIGNIVGSNMINMLLILGIVAIIKPIPINKDSKIIDFPFLIGITTLLMLFACDLIDGSKTNFLSRIDSIVILSAFIIYMVCNIILNNKKRKNFDVNYNVHQLLFDEINENNAKNSKKNVKKLKTWQIILFIILGLGAVIFGSECVSSTAQYLALKMGMSESLVGLTVVSIGTSLPELATSITASLKGENELALGNILGSNIMNIGLILGVVGIIKNVPVSNSILIDLAILTVCTVFFAIICMSRKKNISRPIGGIFVAMYLSYLVFAIIRNYCF